MPTHESEQRRRLSPAAARAAPPASPRPFPKPDPSPLSPSSVTSLCRVLACKIQDFSRFRLRYETCYRLKNRGTDGTFPLLQPSWETFRLSPCLQGIQKFLGYTSHAWILTGSLMTSSS